MPPPAPRENWIRQHAAVIEHTLERQRKAVLSKLGSGSSPLEAFDLERWNRELGDDFYGLALSMSPEVAGPVADAFGIEYDLELASAWLRRNADVAAASFNARTLEHLGDAYATAHADFETGTPGASSRAKTTRQALRDAGADVFATASERGGFLAEERAAIIEAYNRNEAAQQGGARSKRWVTPHPKPRPSHAALDGVEVPMRALFPNGGKYPRDAKLPPGERAGCTCYVDYDSSDVDPVAHELAVRKSPGNFKTKGDVEAWGKSRNLDVSIDELDFNDPKVLDGLNEMAAVIDDELARHPWLMPNTLEHGENAWGFRGVYTKATAPTRRAKEAIDGAYALVDSSAGGPFLVLNPRGFGDPGDNLFAQIGFVLGKTDRAVMRHEMAHVMAKSMSNTGVLQNERSFESFVRSQISGVWGDSKRYSTNQALMRDVSTYAGTNTAEAWAELYLAASDAEVFAGLKTEAARRRVRQFARAANEAWRDGARGRGITGPVDDLIPVP